VKAYQIERVKTELRKDGKSSTTINMVYTEPDGLDQIAGRDKVDYT